MFDNGFRTGPYLTSEKFLPAFSTEMTARRAEGVKLLRTRKETPVRDLITSPISSETSAMPKMFFVVLALADDTTLLSPWGFVLGCNEEVAALSPRSQQSPTPHNAKNLIATNIALLLFVFFPIVTQKWRDDYRCGDGYTTGDGRTAECDPDSNWPCCSPGNWCGNTAAHCDCAGCVYYHNTESGDRKLEKIITIRGNGKEPDMTEAYGVAVSADNEIFVTSLNGVKVFSINGNYLRRFSTVLPGKNVFIMPFDVAIGIEPDHLWVVGTILNSGGNAGNVQVVTYSRSGQAMKKLETRSSNNVGFTRPFFQPSIAIDVCSNKIIVGQGSTVKMFDPDGSLYRSFKVSSGSEGGIGGVTSDSEGNILLTFFNSAFKAVAMYSHSGVKIVEFAGRGNGQLYNFYGICRDKLGNIIVADNENNRVDMFTNRGEFVRTIANIQEPTGIAMGPDGEMVVTTVGHDLRKPQVHKIFSPSNVLILENVAHLDEMPPTGSTVYSMPIKIGQGSGAPAGSPRSWTAEPMLWKCFRT
ncbi:hypothetical protein Bbelb_447260 [Branchiostoma belcheri]|nr:hypothetical protein Bbelb_447260 [Branchiostoma belcheri]